MAKLFKVGVLAWWFMASQATGHYGREQTLVYGPFSTREDCARLIDWIKTHNQQITQVSWCWWSRNN
jgi:hypothetical protein